MGAKKGHVIGVESFKLDFLKWDAYLPTKCCFIVSLSLNTCHSMQPHRYINELEHWRHTSQRPQQYRSPKQSPLQSPTLSPVPAYKEAPIPYDADTASETDIDNKATSKAFQVESPRGWLEYAPSASYSTEHKKIQHTTTNEDTIGTKGSSNNENNGTTRKHKPLEKQRHTTTSNATDSQTGMIQYEG